MPETKTVKAAILLVSCYELGHQPAGITLPAAFLRRAGFDLQAMDISVDGFDANAARNARLVGISVPMHTALRLGVRVAEAIRQLNPNGHICFYGLYALLNADYLLKTVADSIIGGESEELLVELAKTVLSGGPIDIPGVGTGNKPAGPTLARLKYEAPDRRVVGSLERYARLDTGTELKLVGYVEATRGCLHHCTHCPIPPVYDGRFFATPVEILMKDVRGLVEAGALHITFGDPDFLNGPTHALRVAHAMHAEFPELTFDFTAKIEHLIKHRELIPELASLGCIFVVSAVESLSDEVLMRLDKGHHRGDVDEALEITRKSGIALRPSFVSFTPWTTIDDYVDVLDWVEERGLIDHVDPVQYSIRLLVPPGSLLLEDPETARWFGGLNQESFTHDWVHPDPRMDDLHEKVTRAVEQAVLTNQEPGETFYQIREMAYEMNGQRSPARTTPLPLLRAKPPRLTEAWFC